MTPLIKATNLKAYLRFINVDTLNQTQTYDNVYNWTITNSESFWRSYVDYRNLNLSSMWAFYETQLLREDLQNQTALYFLDHAEFKSSNYHDLLNDVSNVSLVLSNIAKNEKTIVIYNGENSKDSIVLYLASLKCGYSWLAIPSDTSTALRQKIESIFQDYQILSVFETEASAATSTNTAVTLKEIKNQLGKFTIFQPAPLSNSALWMLTSGTTGYPKLVKHGVGSLINQIKEQDLQLNLKTNEKLCFLTSPAWMMWNWSITALCLGVSIVLVNPKNLILQPSLWDKISNLKIDCLGLSTYLAHQLSKLKSTTGLFSVDKVLITGGPVNSALITKLNQLVRLSDRNNLFSLCGGTEVNGCFFIETMDHVKHNGYFQSLGLGVSLVSADLNSVKEVPLQISANIPNKPQEILSIDGHSILSSYIDFNHSYLNHPDLIRKDDIGYFVAGRSELIFKSQGQRISFDMLYDFLELQYNAQFIALPYNLDEGFFIVFYESTDVDIQFSELLTKISTGLSAAYVPEAVFKVTHIPRTASGKKSMNKLKTLLADIVFSNISELKEKISEKIQQGFFNE